MREFLDHEQQRVYQKSIAFVARAQRIVSGITVPGAVKDHLDRASEGIPLCIAQGNGRWSTDDRLRYFDMAYGSALECAVALDICRVREFATLDQLCEGKQELSDIVGMLVNLRRSQPSAVGESLEEYRVGHGPSQPRVYFAHERLDVYGAALDLVGFIYLLGGGSSLGARHGTQLDKGVTSIVLNIAEGNGRFAVLDHRRFLDIAYTSALKVAASLDVMVAKGTVRPEEVVDGKHLLTRIVAMLVSMRSSLTKKSTSPSYL